MNAASTTFSQETTVVPTGSRYSLKALTSGTTTVQFRQAIETMNAIGLAGKTVTLSGEYQASSTTTILTKLFYSTSVDVAVGGSWTEITATSGGSVSAVTGSFTKSSSVFAVPSTAKSLMVLFDTGSVSTGLSLYYANIQLEIGTQSSPFTRAGGTIQGELAACQRYYYRLNSSAASNRLGLGQCRSTTEAILSTTFPVTMRVAPTALEQTGTASNYLLQDASGSGVNCNTVPAFNDGTTYGAFTSMTRASGLVAGNACTATTTAANIYLGWSAEL
jgi:hypothetical protein